MISYRKMQITDIPAALTLCRYAGWNQLERDWQIFLNESADHCFVATHNKEKVVGTVTTINYEQRFSWIGMVLVDPEFKRRGIGTQLLHEALNALKNQPCVKLDATPAGREVYLKLDFVDEYLLSRMICKSIDTSIKLSDDASPMSAADFDDILHADKQIFGADRESLIRQMYNNARSLAYVVRQQGKLSGYCFGREGFNFRQIGPIVADNLSVAEMLLSAAIKSAPSQPLIVDATHFSKEWMQWLHETGFEEQRPFTRMYKGVNQYPGIPERQFSILGPEFG